MKMSTSQTEQGEHKVTQELWQALLKSPEVQKAPKPELELIRVGFFLGVHAAAMYMESALEDLQ